MVNSQRASHGFSLLELLIVIGIMTLLVAILLPVISRVRGAARSTACLANLQQWGASFEMYVGANHGQSLQTWNGNDHNSFQWWESLGAYNAKGNAALLCPEAREHPLGAVWPYHYINGTAHQAWHILHKGDVFGSYGANYWVYNEPGNDQSWRAQHRFRLPARDSSHVPLIGDCTTSVSWALNDSPPANLENPSPGETILGIGNFCINRHQMAVNLVFLDGHAEHVSLEGLWKLKWTMDFVPRDVLIPGD